ncbi:hypothetical protein DENSPDRAFT_873945 [Dentipellis sp. KUC8613]|nr:hypothetical protein DENSPDRAFT_873945 [Dentipellis sp. KUC8613]
MASEPIDNPSPDALQALYTSWRSLIDQTYLHVSNASVLATTGASYDQELESALAVASLSTMRAGRNDRVTINCLSPELIAHIFGFLSFDEIPGPIQGACSLGKSYSPGSRHTRYSLGWIKVSHVCQLWRAVALAHSTLWGVDIGSLPGWTEERLRRSQSAPIDVVIRSTDENCIKKEMVSCLLSQLHRTRKLDVSCLADVNMGCGTGEHILSFLSARAPLLESFSLTFGLRNTMAQSDNLGLPEDFLTTNTPRLRSLRLRNVPLPWNCLLPRSLTELCLCLDLPSSRWYILSPLGYCRSGLLSILSQLPQLQVLQLTHSIPKPSSKSPAKEPTQPILLPNLRRLKIEAVAFDCAWFLEHVALSASAQVIIEMPYVYSHSHLEQIGRSLLGIAPIESISLSTELPVCVKGWKKPEESTTQGARYDFAENSTVFQLIFCSMGPLHTMKAILHGLFGRRQIPSIKALRVEGIFDPSYWPQLSALLCAVDYISIDSSPLRLFMKCLAGLDWYGNFQVDLLIFPQLHIVHFIDAMLSADSALLLLQALDQRRKRSMPIQELEFRTHESISRFASLIREAVPRVSFYDVNPSPA